MSNNLGFKHLCVKKRLVQKNLEFRKLLGQKNFKFKIFSKRILNHKKIGFITFWL